MPKKNKYTCVIRKVQRQAYSLFKNLVLSKNCKIRNTCQNLFSKYFK